MHTRTIMNEKIKRCKLLHLLDFENFVFENRLRSQLCFMIKLLNFQKSNPTHNIKWQYKVIKLDFIKRSVTSK